MELREYVFTGGLNSSTSEEPTDEYRRFRAVIAAAVRPVREVLWWIEGVAHRTEWKARRVGRWARRWGRVLNNPCDDLTTGSFENGVRQGRRQANR